MPAAASVDNAWKCNLEQAVLVVIDLQQRLGDAMPNKVLNRVIQNTVLLAQSAALLDIPVLHTEQYPRGLGTTLTAITAALPPSTKSFSKTAFSCCGAPEFSAALSATARRQVVLVGMESHICVLQTALDLQAAGYVVVVVEDGVCSRRLENYQNALDRLRQCQVQIASAESVVFEWMRDAAHPHFKTIQALLR
jgi:nicotinamidase-related amidase